MKYLSTTVFEDCSAEVLRDFYMDNEYRTQWDKTVVEHEQLQVDNNSGIEIGRTIKKFPLLTPREYVLAWRLWEGKDKFYCFIKVKFVLRNKQNYACLPELGDHCRACLSAYCFSSLVIIRNVITVWCRSSGSTFV